jgi:hypothetical protein
VEASTPLRALEHSLRDEHVGCLVENGYAVLDDALPLALCRKLKAEMQALEDNDQMWNSQSYSNDDDGKPHHHINETSLDYKQVRKFAPTFARMEHDPSLVERMRGVPGLEQLGNQHVRIQINAGHGGCYTMHTDQGTMYTDSGNSSTGQTLCLTALVYLNEDWQPGDGGELRIFPYPHPPEVIAPLAGRLVLFEPRMVHDVLPNWKKRFCFTLWCSKKDPNQASRQIDHESVTNIELSMALSDGAAIAEAWRKRHGHPIVYGATLPRAALLARTAHDACACGARLGRDCSDLAIAQRGARGLDGQWTHRAPRARSRRQPGVAPRHVASALPGGGSRRGGARGGG